MSNAVDILQKIVYYYTSTYHHSTTEGVLVKYFFMTRGLSEEKVQSTLRYLVRKGYVKCVLCRGPARWDTAYQEGTQAEIIPTKIAMRMCSK